MPGVCIHEFFWPLRAADGRYYQVCRRCGSQREYDWMSMQRVDGGPETTPAPVVSAAKGNARPGLKLLVELEPAYRVFLRNLFDTLRPGAPAASGLPAVPFWREMLFYSDIPWQRFAESMVCHMVVLAMLLLLSVVWNSPDLPRQRSMFENTHLTYYKPTGSFPALRGSPARARQVFRKPAESALRGSIKVAAEKSQAAIQPPDIRLKGPSRPNMVSTNVVPPVMPLASTGSSRLNLPSVPTTIVAPAPEVTQATSRRLGLPQASGVAPAPEPGAVSSKRVMTVPGASVIGPPPVLQASIRRSGDINIGPATVVAPAPRLPVGEQSTVSAAGEAVLGSLLASAVPPPPSAPRAGSLATGRTGSLAGTGLQVVPPPVSVQGVGNSTAGGRLNSVSANSLSGNASTRGDWSGAGAQIVPPAPSLQDAGNSGAGQRASSFSKAGLGTTQGVAPAPSLGAGGNSDHGGRQVAMNDPPALGPAPPPVTDSPRQQAEKSPEPATEEMPLRLIGLAMALPSSTYFSNYEVYIAERRLRKNLTELVKLVYVYLPYQRRLSEYGVDNSKVYKLLVSRDRSCDESLMQMTWPEADPHPDAQNPADSPALSTEDKKSMLPCYRTTADDYRRAISRR